MIYRFVFLCLLSLMFSCNNGRTTKIVQNDTISKAATVTKNIPASTPVPAVAYFLDSLIDHSRLIIDNRWQQDIDSGTLLEDYSIMIPSMGDDPDSCVSFPFRGIDFKYCEVRNWKDSQFRKNCFIINNERMSPDTDDQRIDPHFVGNSIHQFSFNNRKYIVFNGMLRMYSGNGDRIHFNYFFDVTKPPYVQNIYTNFWGWVAEPFVYGTLNDDDYLDRIVFDGTYGYNEADTIRTITAETYKNNKWYRLKDERGKRYYIELDCPEGQDCIRIRKSHWMRPLPHL